MDVRMGEVQDRSTRPAATARLLGPVLAYQQLCYPECEPLFADPRRPDQKKQLRQFP
jgi:hypothetical protein